jgi:Putative binding domain, N-terminal
MILDRHQARIVTLGITVALCVASCNKKETAVTTGPTCAFSVVQPTTSFGPEGGTGSIPITVTAGTGCTWTATSSAAFITFTTGSGTGNGTAAFTVAVNTGAERTSALTVAGTSITITQRAAVVTPPATLAAPTPRSPSGGQDVELRPTLVVNNAATTGNVGTVTYRFEVSSDSTFPNDPAKTITQDGVAQGSGTTGWPVPRDLTQGVVYFWRARATNGTITTAFSAVESFKAGGGLCSIVLSPTSVSVGAGGGSSTITITTSSVCNWVSISNDAFIALTSPSSGSGNGSLTFSVLANTGAARTGTITISGQTITVSQAAAGSQGGGNLFAGFRLLDPGRTGSATTTSCWLSSLTSQPTQCTLESTSFPRGTNSITGYSWVVSYTYPNEKAFTQVGTDPQFSFTDMCGLTGSTDSGVDVELKVTLTVTDSDGNSVTVRSNEGSQPLLTLRAYICGI